MCGIAGQVDVNAGSGRVLSDMCDALVHRGPDDVGAHVEQGLELGMRRLAIIDIAHGQQPIYNDDRSLVVVFNGEIYNFQELRAGLAARGHRFRSEGDTEVILHLYEEHGIDLVHRLRGMFALAIWDRRDRKLVLARDRVGKKPLYYAQTATGLVFGSELKALLRHPGVRRTIDYQALDHYLTFQYVPAPWSILEQVRKLPPASVLVYRDEQVSVSEYWRLDYQRKTEMSRPEAVEHVRGLVREATAIRLTSERPLGAFLSGGIDSSLVVAAMAEASPQPIKTFSIGFDDAGYDEREYARLVSQHFGTEHHELVMDPDPVATLAAVGDAYDEPFADSSAVPSLEVARLTRQHVTVALTGDGGDESFGGYTRYAYNAAVERVPVTLRSGLARGGRLLPARGDSRRPVGRMRRIMVSSAGDAGARYLAVMSYFDEPGKRALYLPRMAAALSPTASTDLMRSWWDASAAPDVVDRMLDVDVRSYLPGDLLMKVDIATMRHSLEARAPLLDQRVMEFGASLPSSWKVHGRSTKVLLKEAARGWLPDAVLDRPKMGFGVPVARWLREDLREPARDLLTDRTAVERGLFDPANVRRLLDEHDAGVDHGPRIWALLMLEQWHRRWLDVPSTAGSAALP